MGASGRAQTLAPLVGAHGRNGPLDDEVPERLALRRERECNRALQLVHESQLERGDLALLEDGRMAWTTTALATSMTSITCRTSAPSGSDGFAGTLNDYAALSLSPA